MKQRVFIVDDHPIVRLGYSALINGEPGLEVCATAATAMEALDQIPQARPDVAIVDLSLGGMSGLDLIKELRAQYPDLPILVVSTHDEVLFGERALLAGAHGYIMKSEVDTAIIGAIRHVLGGGVYLSEQMNAKLLHQYQQRGERLTAGQSPIEQLSDRELEVFELMGRGYSTKQIADALRISPKTVESHRGRIKNKLAIESTTELVQRATLWVARQG